MFTAKNMSSGAAESYHAKDSYYDREGAGKWSGELAVVYDRAGQVIDKADWNNAVHGRGFDGAQLVSYQAREYAQPDGTVKVQEQRGGIDLTYSLPKSMSVVVEAYRDSHDARLKELATAIQDSHRIAVEKTNSLIEKEFLAARITTGKITDLEFTGKGLIGNWEHHVNRNHDMQYHTHSFMVNMTQTKDGKWRAIESKPIFENQRYIGQHHMSELAVQLRERGVPLLDRSHGNVEIAGLPKEILDHFSSRSKQIDERVEDFRTKYPNANEAQLRQMACLDTRNSKEIIQDITAQRAEWRAEIGELGYSDRDIADRIDLERERAAEKYASLPDAHAAIEKAADVLSYGESVFSRQELVLQAAQLFPSAHRIEDLEKSAAELIRDGRGIRDLSETGEHITTLEMARIEAENIGMTRGAAGQVQPIISEPQARERAESIRISGDRAMTQSQQGAYTTILSSPDRIVLTQGYAGTGKTTLFSQLKKDFDEAGLKVRGLGYTGRAAAELQNASGIASTTIHSFLQRGGHMEGGTVYVIDEASMVGSRQLNELLHQAKAVNARVILSGDRWQIPSIAAGKPFADIQDDRQIAQSYLTDIVRQREGTKEHEISKAFVERNVEKIIDALEKAGSIHYEADDQKRSTRAFEDVLRDWKGTISMATTNAQVKAEGQRFHDELLNRGEIGGRGKNEVTVGIKEPVSFRNDAERHFAHNYNDGDFLQINQKWEGGPKRGTTLEITGRDEVRGLLTAKGSLGREYGINIREHGMDVTAYAEREINISQGEKVMFLKNSLSGPNALGVRNGDLAYVKSLSEDGRHMVADRVVDLKAGKTEEIKIPVDKYNYFRYGYVATPDKSQGATAPRAVGRDLADFQRLYVAGTREYQELSLHFRDPQALREALTNVLDKSSSWEHTKGKEGITMDEKDRDNGREDRSKIADGVSRAGEGIGRDIGSGVMRDVGREIDAVAEGRLGDTLPGRAVGQIAGAAREVASLIEKSQNQVRTPEERAGRAAEYRQEREKSKPLRESLNYELLHGDGGLMTLSKEDADHSADHSQNHQEGHKEQETGKDREDHGRDAPDESREAAKEDREIER